MKINELMIGNIVRWKYGEDEYNTVHSIDPEQIDLQIITPFGVHPDDIEGIPLTEEWLIKLGFEKKPMYGKHNIYFFIKNKLYYCENDFYSFAYSNNSLEIKEPKYVHQLQNLYFALTGEELTIKQTESI